MTAWQKNWNFKVARIWDVVQIPDALTIDFAAVTIDVPGMQIAKTMKNVINNNCCL